MEKYSISLNLDTIAWIAKHISVVRENYVENLARFRKIDSGEHGTPAEYGYDSKDEFLEDFLKFTDKSEIDVKAAKDFMVAATETLKKIEACNEK